MKAKAKSRISDLIKQDKNNPIKSAKDFQALYSDPQTLISSDMGKIGSLLNSEKDLVDICGISIVDHYVFALGHFSRANDLLNYNFLHDNLFKFISFLLEKFPTHLCDKASLLHHLANNKNYNIISEIINFFKENECFTKYVLLNSNKEKKLISQFLLEQRLRSHNVGEQEKIKDILNVLKELPSLKDIIEEQEENFILDLNKKLIIKLMKDKNFRGVLDLLNDLNGEHVFKLILLNDIGFNLVNNFINYGDENLLEILLQKINEKVEDEKSQIKLFLNSMEKIILTAIKKENLRIFEMILKEIKNYIGNGIILSAEHLKDGMKNNVFHYIAKIKSENREDFYNSITSFLNSQGEEYQKLIHQLLNEENNNKYLPFHLLLLNFKQDDSLIVTILKQTDLCINTYTSKNDYYYIEQISTLAKSKKHNKKGNKFYMSKYSIHPSEVLCEISDSNLFSRVIQFLNEKELFNPFIMYKLKSSLHPRSVLHEITKKKLDTESANIIFNYLVKSHTSENSYVLSSYEKEFYYVNLFDILTFINKFNFIQIENVVPLLNSYLLEMDKKHEELSKQVGMHKILNQDKFKIYSKSKTLWIEQKMMMKHKNIVYLIENFETVKLNIKDNKTTSFDNATIYENVKEKNKFFILSTIKNNPLINILNNINDYTQFSNILNNLLFSSDKDFTFQIIKILITNLKPVQVSFLIEIFKTNHNNLVTDIMKEKFKMNDSDPQFFLFFLYKLNEIIFNKIPFDDKWINLFIIYNATIQHFPINYLMFIKLYLYQNFNPRFNFEKNDKVENNIKYCEMLRKAFVLSNDDFDVKKLSEIKHKNLKICLLNLLIANEDKQKKELLNLFIKALRSHEKINSDQIETLNAIVLNGMKSIKNIDYFVPNFIVDTQALNIFTIIDEKLQSLIETNFLEMLSDYTREIIAIECRPFFNCIINLLKNNHESYKQFLKIYLENSFDNVVPLWLKKRNLTEQEEVVLLKNFIYSYPSNKKNVDKSRFIQMKQLLTENKNKKAHKDTECENDNYYQIFFQLVSDKSLFFLFNWEISEKENKHLNAQFIKIYLKLNKQYKQQLITNLHHIPTELLENVLSEDSQFFVSFNAFSFLLNYQSEFYSKYESFLKSIQKSNDKITNEATAVYSHYTQINSEYLKTQIDSVSLLQFAKNLENFFTDCNKNNFDLNKFLQNKSFAECLSRILHTKMNKYWTHNHNMKILQKILLLYINYSSLFDYSNYFNTRLLLLTVKIFIITNVTKKLNDTFMSNVLTFHNNNNFVYENLESLISSVCFISNDLLKLSNIEYFGFYIKNLLRIKNPDKLQIVQHILKYGYLTKLITSYFIFIDDVESLKLFKEIASFDLNGNDYFKIFDLQNEICFISIRLQRNNFTKFLFKYNNSTMFFFSIILNGNNYYNVTKVYSYLNDDKNIFPKNSVLQSNLLKYDFKKSVLVSKNFQIFRQYKEYVKFSDKENYDTVASNYRDEKVYDSHLKDFAFLFSDFEMSKLFHHCIVNDNLLMAELILHNLTTEEILKDLNYTITLTNKENIIQLLVVKNNYKTLSKILDCIKNSVEYVKILYDQEDNEIVNDYPELNDKPYELFEQKILHDKEGRIETPLKLSLLIKSYQCFFILLSYYPPNYRYEIFKSISSGSVDKYLNEIMEFEDSIIIKENAPELNRNIKLIKEVSYFFNSSTSESKKNLFSTLQKQLKINLIYCPNFISLDLALLLMPIKDKEILSMIFEILISIKKILPEQKVFDFIMEDLNGEEFILNLFYYMEKNEKCVIPIKKYLPNYEIKNNLKIYDLSYVVNNNPDIDLYQIKENFSNSVFKIYALCIEKNYTRLEKIIYEEFNLNERMDEFVNYIKENNNPKQLYSVIHHIFSITNLFKLFIQQYSLQKEFMIKFKISPLKPMSNSCNLSDITYLFTIIDLEKLNISRLDLLLSSYQTLDYYNPDDAISHARIEMAVDLNYNFLLFLQLVFNPNDFVKLLVDYLTVLTSRPIKEIMNFGLSGLSNMFICFNKFIKILKTDEEIQQLMSSFNFTLNETSLSETNQKIFDHLFDFFNSKLIENKKCLVTLDIKFLKDFYLNYFNEKQIDLNKSYSLYESEKHFNTTEIFDNLMLEFFNQITYFNSAINSISGSLKINDFIEKSFKEVENKNLNLTTKLVIRNVSKGRLAFFQKSGDTIIKQKLFFDKVPIQKLLENYFNLFMRKVQINYIQLNKKDMHAIANNIKERNAKTLSEVLISLLSEMKYSGKINNEFSNFNIMIPFYFDSETLTYKEVLTESNIIDFIKNLVMKLYEVLKFSLSFSTNALVVYPDIFGQTISPSTEKIVDLLHNSAEEIKAYSKLLSESFKLYMNGIYDETEWLKYSCLVYLCENQMKISLKDESVRLVVIDYLQMKNYNIDVENLFENEKTVEEIDLFLSDINNYEVTPLREVLDLYLFDLKTFYLEETVFFKSHEKFTLFFKDLSKKI